MDDVNSTPAQDGLLSELVNHETSQTTQLIQQSETGNARGTYNSKQEPGVERGSSCGSSNSQPPPVNQAISLGDAAENVAVSVFTNASSTTITDPLAGINRAPTNMAVPMGVSSSSSSSSDDDTASLLVIPKTRSEEPVSELGQLPNPNSNLMYHAQNNNINGGAVSSGSVVANAPELQPLGTISSSTNTPALRGAPQQPHPPKLEFPQPRESRSVAGSSTWSHTNLSVTPNPSPPIQSGFSSFQSSNPNHSLGINAPNAIDIPRSSSLLNGISAPAVTDGLVNLAPLPGQYDHKANQIYPGHYSNNAFPDIVSQVLEQLLPVSQGIGVIGRYGTNNFVQPFGQSMASKNFTENSISQQPGLHSNLFSQNCAMTGTGVANQTSHMINPRQPVFTPYNILNAAFTSSASAAAGFWPQQNLHNRSQNFSQVPPLGNLASDAHLEYSSPLGTQNYQYYHANQQPSVTPAVYDQPSVYNSMPPQVPNFNQRPVPFSCPYQQLNEVQAASNIPAASNSMSSRIRPSLQASPGVQQLNRSPMVQNMLGSQEYSNNSATPTGYSVAPTSNGFSSMSSRLSSTNQPRQLGTLPNGAGGFRSSIKMETPSILTRSGARQQMNGPQFPAVASRTGPIQALINRLRADNRLQREISGSARPSSSSGNVTINSPASVVLNPQTQQAEQGYQITKVELIPDQSVISPFRELGRGLVHPRAAPNRLEIGEPASSLPKRVRRDEVVPPPAAATRNVNRFGISQQSEEYNEADSATASRRPADPRRIPNAVYDPKYAEIGLPLDPHLRMFASFTQQRHTGKK